MSSLVRRWVRGCEHSATHWEGFVIFFADCVQTTSVAIFRAHLIKANIRLWVWPRARRRLYIKTVSVLYAAECTVASAQNKLVWLPSGFFAISHWHFVCVCVIRFSPTIFMIICIRCVTVCHSIVVDQSSVHILDSFVAQTMKTCVAYHFQDAHEHILKLPSPHLIAVNNAYQHLKMATTPTTTISTGIKNIPNFNMTFPVFFCNLRRHAHAQPSSVERRQKLNKMHSHQVFNFGTNSRIKNNIVTFCRLVGYIKIDIIMSTHTTHTPKTQIPRHHQNLFSKFSGEIIHIFILMWTHAVFGFLSIRTFLRPSLFALHA